MQISSHLNEPVVGHMRTDFIRLHSSQTIAQALEAIRGQTSAGRIIYFYVLDEHDHLRGSSPHAGCCWARPSKPWPRSWSTPW